MVSFRKVNSKLEVTLREKNIEDKGNLIILFEGLKAKPNYNCFFIIQKFKYGVFNFFFFQVI